MTVLQEHERRIERLEARMDKHDEDEVREHRELWVQIGQMKVKLGLLWAVAAVIGTTIGGGLVTLLLASNGFRIP